MRPPGSGQPGATGPAPAEVWNRYRTAPHGPDVAAPGGAVTDVTSALARGLLAAPSASAHCMCWPPLIAMLAPVTKAASSEAR